MTIKKQFVLLSSIIIAIPLICSLFVITFSYQHSSIRYLLKGYQELDIINSEADAELIKNTIKQLPADMQLVVCSPKEKQLLFSSIPEIKIVNNWSIDILWQLIKDTSDKYFYQFSTPPLQHEKLLIVTRIPRMNYNPVKNHDFFTLIFLILFISTIISLICIILISKTIFHSIIKIENKTQQLANGNLETPVEPETPEKGNEITSILTSLEKMRSELIEAQERKNRLMMGISHDLRTPVAVIKGYSEAITDEVITDKDEIKTTVSLINTKVTQLGEMIDTLINFMKLNNTETKEALVPNSITNLITDFGKYAEMTGALFKRRVILDINFPKNIIIPFNNQLVHRALENIFSNAIRYTKENDTITIASYLDEKNSEESLILKISDTGIGIAKKDLNSIFDMFFRGTNSRLEEGLGIGLSVVKTIIDNHGWTISVDSKKNAGSCFTIVIPVKKN